MVIHNEVKGYISKKDQQPLIQGGLKCVSSAVQRLQVGPMVVQLAGFMQEHENACSPIYLSWSPRLRTILSRLVAVRCSCVVDPYSVICIVG